MPFASLTTKLHPRTFLLSVSGCWLGASSIGGTMSTGPRRQSSARLWCGGGLPSRPEAFHHRPLTEPCVRVSPYTARRGFENASLRKRPLSEGKRFVLVTQL